MDIIWLTPNLENGMKIGVINCNWRRKFIQPTLIRAHICSYPLLILSLGVWIAMSTQFSERQNTLEYV